MLNTIFRTVILVFFLSLISGAFSSCQKAKDTIGVIIVKDSFGNTVAGATVVLHQDGAISQQGNSTKPELRKTNTTDLNGRAEFTYELEAIFNIEAQKAEGNNVYTGSNVIRLLKEKTVTIVVEIN